MKTTTKLALLALAAWALWRWRAAHDMGVPLDLAFKHPATSIMDLYDQIHGLTAGPGGTTGATYSTPTGQNPGGYLQ